MRAVRGAAPGRVRLVARARAAGADPRRPGRARDPGDRRGPGGGAGCPARPDVGAAAVGAPAARGRGLGRQPRNRRSRRCSTRSTTSTGSASSSPPAPGTRTCCWSPGPGRTAWPGRCAGPMRACPTRRWSSRSAPTRSAAALLGRVLRHRGGVGGGDAGGVLAAGSPPPPFAILHALLLALGRLPARCGTVPAVTPCSGWRCSPPGWSLLAVAGAATCSPGARPGCAACPTCSARPASACLAAAGAGALAGQPRGSGRGRAGSVPAALGAATGGPGRRPAVRAVPGDRVRRGRRGVAGLRLPGRPGRAAAAGAAWAPATRSRSARSRWSSPPRTRSPPCCVGDC